MADKEERSPEKMTVVQLVATLKVGQLWAILGVGVTLLCGSFGLGYTINSWAAKGDIAEAKVKVTELYGKLNNLNISNEELQQTHAKLKVKENVLRLFHFYNVAKLDEQGIATEVALARKHLENLFPFSPPSSVPVLSPAARLAQRREREAYEKKKEEFYQQLDADGKKPIDDAKALLATAEVELSNLEEVNDQRGSAIRVMLSSQEEKTLHMKVTFANISKGSGGTGTIKLAYDGMELAIPNEFLPVATH